MNKGVTIIICTYNGVERLGDTISHIAKLSVPPEIKWEVILADNNSSDHSSAFAIAEWEKHHLPSVNFSTVSQPKPGKFYALQDAIEAARYEYLIICDDDNWLAEDYVTRIFSRLETMPQVAAIGGYGIPVTSGQPLPEWFKNYHVAYAVGAQAKESGIIKSGGVLWGAGMTTRRSVYLEMYENYPTLLTESNNDIVFAEDTEFCIRLQLRGYQLYYDSELIYQHYIPDSKLNTEYRDGKRIREFDEARHLLRKYYAAQKGFLKTRGRPGLWLLTFLSSCLRCSFFFPERTRIKAKDTLFQMLPFWTKSDPVSTQIKAFIKKK